MEAFQLRLWDGRLGRWLSVDPYGQYHSPYLGMGNNPINRIDPDGGWDDFYEQLDANGNGTGIYEWFDGSGQIDGYQHLGANFSVSDSYNNVVAWGSSEFGRIVSWTNKGGLFDHLISLNEVIVTGGRRNHGNVESVISENDWISQFTQPRPKVACKRTCDIIAGVSPLNRAINVARESNNQIVPTNNFTRGIETIDNYLNSGRPITVGVHHKFNGPHNEGTTDHYIVIVGRGTSNNQIYYRFYDVATKHRNLGTSPLNRLYLNGNLATGNTAYTNKRTYTLSQIRPN